MKTEIQEYKKFYYYLKLNFVIENLNLFDIGEASAWRQKGVV